MELYEWQAKELLSTYGIPFQSHFVAKSLPEVEKYLQKTKLSSAVVKIQVHAGGRGKAGGVVLCHSKEEILQAASKLLGMKIQNRQTGPEGIIARHILISELADIKKEYYLSITIDRAKEAIVLIASKEGGAEIEEVAKENPKAILAETIDKHIPLKSAQIERIFQFLDLSEALYVKVQAFIQGIIEAFFAYDALLIEINPLILTNDNTLLALDAKMTVDDNALFRQPKIAELEDREILSPQERAAEEAGLAYVSMPGTIGCMVNGAGLAMATMDLILLKGGKPANFLDVGGGASKEKVTTGFKILFSDKRVKAILVNIFGGIMNCAIIAEALKQAVTKEVQIPIVIRMEGTNVDAAKKIILNSRLPVTVVDTFDEAAALVVQKGL